MQTNDRTKPQVQPGHERSISWRLQVLGRRAGTPWQREHREQLEVLFGLMH